jgi:hypothetical protein
MLGDPLDDMPQWIEVVQFGGAHEAVDRGGAFTSDIRARIAVARKLAIIMRTSAGKVKNEGRLVCISLPCLGLRSGKVTITVDLSQVVARRSGWEARLKRHRGMIRDRFSFTTSSTARHPIR